MTAADELLLRSLEECGLISPDSRERLWAEIPDGLQDAKRLDWWLQQLQAREQLKPSAVADCLAQSMGMERVRWETAECRTSLPNDFPVELARRLGAFPVGVAGDGTLILAVSDPFDLEATDTLARHTGMGIRALLATPEELEGLWGQSPVDSTPDSDPRDRIWIEESPEAYPRKTTGDDPDDGPVNRYLFRIIGEALARRASDIHLEPLDSRFRIRMRVDGVLSEFEQAPKALHPGILARIKVLADLSLDESRRPQDGRFQAKVGSREVDLRVSLIPSIYGECAALRILERDERSRDLSEVGLGHGDREWVESMADLPHGIVLVTGPTGSGKTTTLYAILRYLDHSARKIITVEDPVEQDHPGVNQVQVHEPAGMTFSAALRSMLRQSPDTIMVGEIRDRETAEVAIHAALTGHLVLSGLHTNDTAGAVVRMVDLGVPPFLLGAALRGVLAERLVRKIDPDHRVSYLAGPAEREWLGQGDEPDSALVLWKGIPHRENGGTGFRGRCGIFERLSINDRIREMIHANASLPALRREALDLGMRTIRQDGIRKVIAGITTIPEVLAVTSESPIPFPHPKPEAVYEL